MGNSSNSYNVVLNSMGTAGVNLVRSLKPVVPFGQREIAEKLYQAPSVLLSSLDKNTAENISQVLNETGADVCVLDDAALPEPGTGEWEVAINWQSFDTASDVIKEIVTLIGVSPEQAVSLLVRSPAVIVSRVSEATVSVFRDRLEPSGVEVMASKPEQSHFDLYLVSNDLSSQTQLKTFLVENRIPLHGDAGSSQSPLLATGLTHEQCQALWQRFEHSSIEIVLLNQVYQRFDLRLLSLTDQPEVNEWLTDTCGIPDKVIPRLKQSLPVVVARSLTIDALGQHLNQLSEWNIDAEGNLTAFQGFDIKFADPNSLRGKVSRIASTFGLLTKHKAPTWEARLQNTPERIAGPFNNQQGRWLVRELKNMGIKSALVEIKE